MVRHSSEAPSTTPGGQTTLGSSFYPPEYIWNSLSDTQRDSFMSTVSASLVAGDGQRKRPRIDLASLWAHCFSNYIAIWCEFFAAKHSLCISGMVLFHRRICDLARAYKWQECILQMALDHHQMVVDKGDLTVSLGDWEIGKALESSYLRPDNVLPAKTAPTTPTTRSTRSTAAPNNDSVICEKFNSSAGCHWRTCHRRHVCSKCGNDHSMISCNPRRYYSKIVFHIKLYNVWSVSSNTAQWSFVLADPASSRSTATSHLSHLTSALSAAYPMIAARTSRGGQTQFRFSMESISSRKAAPLVALYTDACDSGLGLFFFFTPSRDSARDWLSAAPYLPSTHAAIVDASSACASEAHINTKEVTAILQAFLLHSLHWAHHRVLAFTDMDELLSLTPPAWFSRQPIFVSAGHAKLVWNGLAEGTRKGYRSAQRSYTRSCALNGLQPWPATAPAIYAWLTERLLGAGRSPPVKPDTAMSELSALRAYHVDNGLSDAVFDLHAKHFRRMVDGARRLQPPREKRVRNPIPRTSVITLSGNISHLPAQPLRLSKGPER
ncbi:hypothetical protein N7481_010311 [Penicillium waksmanii]|uniref:uncharacterized protein n=1 Tax=Penicillium waksmanii TaxID=69791 RepID=UPI0025497815|nr:uncharacterized protein N7481_010311 [Penicillium waksmanii]KAJ5976604.1 hypothetical protein N7481_010311 [Penicillium waksmanii]